MRPLTILLLLMLVGMSGCENGEAARRKQIAAKLKQIGLALHEYHAKQAEQNSAHEAPEHDDQQKTDTPSP